MEQMRMFVREEQRDDENPYSESGGNDLGPGDEEDGSEDDGTWDDDTDEDMGPSARLFQPPPSLASDNPSDSAPPSEPSGSGGGSATVSSSPEVSAGDVNALAEPSQLDEWEASYLSSLTSQLLGTINLTKDLFDAERKGSTPALTPLCQAASLIYVALQAVAITGYIGAKSQRLKATRCSTSPPSVVPTSPLAFEILSHSVISGAELARTAPLGSFGLIVAGGSMQLIGTGLLFAGQTSLLASLSANSISSSSRAHGQRGRDHQMVQLATEEALRIQLALGYTPPAEKPVSKPSSENEKGDSGAGTPVRTPALLAAQSPLLRTKGESVTASPSFSPAWSGLGQGGPSPFSLSRQPTEASEKEIAEGVAFGQTLPQDLPAPSNSQDQASELPMLGSSSTFPSRSNWMKSVACSLRHLMIFPDAVQGSLNSPWAGQSSQKREPARRITSMFDSPPEDEGPLAPSEVPKPSVPSTILAGFATLARCASQVLALGAPVFFPGLVECEEHVIQVLSDLQVQAKSDEDGLDSGAAPADLYTSWFNRFCRVYWECLAEWLVMPAKAHTLLLGELPISSSLEDGTRMGDISPELKANDYELVTRLWMVVTLSDDLTSTAIFPDVESQLGDTYMLESELDLVDFTLKAADTVVEFQQQIAGVQGKGTWIGVSTSAGTLCNCLLRSLSRPWWRVPAAFPLPSTRLFGTPEIEYRKTSSTLQLDGARCAESITIASGNCRALQTVDKVWGLVLGREGFPRNSGIHKWDVYLKKCTASYMLLGVARRDVSFSTFLGGDRHGWGMLGSRSLYHARTRIQSHYGRDFRSGMTIRLVLDTNKGTLSFGTPNNSWGVAFRNLYDNLHPHAKPEEATLYPAVAMFQKHDEVLFRPVVEERSTKAQGLDNPALEDPSLDNEIALCYSLCKQSAPAYCTLQSSLYHFFDNAIGWTPGGRIDVKNLLATTLGTVSSLTGTGLQFKLEDTTKLLAKLATCLAYAPATPESSKFTGLFEGVWEVRLEGGGSVKQKTYYLKLNQSSGGVIEGYAAATYLDCIQASGEGATVTGRIDGQCLRLVEKGKSSGALLSLELNPTWTCFGGTYADLDTNSSSAAIGIRLNTSDMRQRLAAFTRDDIRSLSTRFKWTFAFSTYTSIVSSIIANGIPVNLESSLLELQSTGTSPREFDARRNIPLSAAQLVDLVEGRIDTSHSEKLAVVRRPRLDLASLTRFPDYQLKHLTTILFRSHRQEKPIAGTMQAQEAQQPIEETKDVTMEDEKSEDVVQETKEDASAPQTIGVSAVSNSELQQESNQVFETGVFNAGLHPSLGLLLLKTLPHHFGTPELWTTEETATWSMGDAFQYLTAESFELVEAFLAKNGVLQSAYNSLMTDHGVNPVIRRAKGITLKAFRMLFTATLFHSGGFDDACQGNSSTVVVDAWQRAQDIFLRMRSSALEGNEGDSKAVMSNLCSDVVSISYLLLTVGSYGQYYQTVRPSAALEVKVVGEKLETAFTKLRTPGVFAAVRNQLFEDFLTAFVRFRLLADVANFLASGKPAVSEQVWGEWKNLSVGEGAQNHAALNSRPAWLAGVPPRGAIDPGMTIRLQFAITSKLAAHELRMVLPFMGIEERVKSGLSVHMPLVLSGLRTNSPFSVPLETFWVTMLRISLPRTLPPLEPVHSPRTDAKDIDLLLECPFDAPLLALYWMACLPTKQHGLDLASLDFVGVWNELARLSLSRTSCSHAWDAGLCGVVLRCARTSLATAFKSIAAALSSIHASLEKFGLKPCHSDPKRRGELYEAQPLIAAFSVNKKSKTASEQKIPEAVEHCLRREEAMLGQVLEGALTELKESLGVFLTHPPELELAPWMKEKGAQAVPIPPKMDELLRPVDLPFLLLLALDVAQEYSSLDCSSMVSQEWLDLLLGLSLISPFQSSHLALRIARFVVCRLDPAELVESGWNSIQQTLPSRKGLGTVTRAVTQGMFPELSSFIPREGLLDRSPEVQDRWDAVPRGAQLIISFLWELLGRLQVLPCGDESQRLKSQIDEQQEASAPDHHFTLEQLSGGATALESLSRVISSPPLGIGSFSTDNPVPFSSDKVNTLMNEVVYTIRQLLARSSWSPLVMASISRLLPASPPKAPPKKLPAGKYPPASFERVASELAGASFSSERILEAAKCTREACIRVIEWLQGVDSCLESAALTVLGANVELLRPSAEVASTNKVSSFLF